MFDPFNCRSLGLEKGAPLEETVVEVSVHRSLSLSLSQSLTLFGERRILGLGFEEGNKGGE